MTLRGTDAQMAALDSYIEHGDYKMAAHRLGISEETCRGRVKRLRERNHMNTLLLVLQRDRELRQVA